MIGRNIVEPDEQLLINFDNSINNDQEVEELNEEENQPIDVFNENNLRQFLNFINAPEEVNNEPESSDSSSESSDTNSNHSQDEEMATFFVKPSKFSRTYGEDPLEWLQEFITAAKANNWNNDRKLTVFEAYLRKGPREWHDE